MSDEKRTLVIDGKVMSQSELSFSDYRKRPVVVQAVQIDTEFSVTTLEGQMVGPPGHYLIRGVEGELYPCDPGIFAKTYEPVSSLSKEYLEELKGIPPEKYKAMTEGRFEAEQPPPTPGRRAVSPVAREMFEDILKQQEERGLRKYGTRLETFNGRNAVLDAMAEVVDTFQYLTQAYMEQQARDETNEGELA